MSLQEAPAPRRADDAWREGKSGLLVIGVFFGVFGLWAAFAPLDSGVVATGEVKVSGNRQVVQHRDGGTVSTVAVREGDHVTAGQLLVELSDVEIVARENALTGQAIELQASRERLLAEGAGRSTLARPAAWATLPEEHLSLADAVFERQQRELATSLAATNASVSVLGQRQRGTTARVDGFQQEIEAVDRQLVLVEQELTSLQALEAEGFAATSRVRAVERAQVELIGRRASLIGQIEQSRESVSETQLQSISLRRDRAGQIAEELRMTDARLAEVLPQLQATRLQLESTRVRAPAAGRIVGLSVFNAGAVVRPGDSILELVPDEQGLILEVRVSPTDADNVAPGQPTIVRFSAFEGRSIPFAHGAVERISADRFEDNRTGAPYFLADVRVGPDEMALLARSAGVATLALQPGLPVEVIIPLRKRTALQYLLEPLTQSLWRSFRQN
ncbi:type I secretion membrane fusion protein of hlyD family [alpha proteobacterium U9-1i]|nr:type I secretion membrane fusion protein of hlyD family [alpha proteobacterium U9-1i]